MDFDNTQPPNDFHEPQDSNIPPQPPVDPVMHNIPDFKHAVV